MNTLRMVLSTWLLSCVVTLSPLATASDNATAWRTLAGAAIEAVLEGKTIEYTDGKGITQQFNADGSTIYAEGRPSFGRWRVSDTQYCSVWPPASGWVCYDVLLSADENSVRFVGDSGRIWEGKFKS